MTLEEEDNILKMRRLRNKCKKFLYKITNDTSEQKKLVGNTEHVVEDIYEEIQGTTKPLFEVLVIQMSVINEDTVGAHA